LHECREVVPAQEIALLAPLDPVAFNLIVEFLVARACLVGNATGNIGCEFKEEGANRREIVGKITGGANELVALCCACGVFRARDVSADPALGRVERRIEAPKVAQASLIGHASHRRFG
jgi:hypothetical protein